jgi:hypothetical protein
MIVILCYIFRIIAHKLFQIKHRKIYIKFKTKIKLFCFIRQSNDATSPFLNDYPGRFKVEYASPDDVNDLCFKNNHIRYDASVTHRPSRYAVNILYYSTETKNVLFIFYLVSN